MVETGVNPCCNKQVRCTYLFPRHEGFCRGRDQMRLNGGVRRTKRVTTTEGGPRSANAAALQP